MNKTIALSLIIVASVLRIVLSVRPPHQQRRICWSAKVKRCMASAGVTLALSYSTIASGTISTAAAAVAITGEPMVAASPVNSMRAKKDEVAIVRSQRSWIDFSGRLTDVENNVIVGNGRLTDVENNVIALNEKVDNIENNVIVVNGRLTDVELSIVELKQDAKTNLFISLSTTVFLYWNSNRKTDADKADMNKRMDADKAEMNKRMDDVNKRMLIMFVVTTGVAILAALKQ